MTATHILHWGDGRWELQSIAGYASGDPQTDPEWTLEGEPRDIDAADFTEWMSGLTGFPVDVEQSVTRITTTRVTCRRALEWNREEPVWLVYPAEVTS
jgi:hypothetical protein